LAEAGSQLNHLQRELDRQKRINAALVRRVEKMTDAGGDAFGLFQNSLMLDQQVSERTAALESVKEELERSNGELRAAKRAAEATAQTKAAFLATMSHEIRTPLNGIIGMLALVMDRQLPADLRADLETVSGSADALRGLLDDILDYSRLDAGSRELEENWFNVHTICYEVADLFQQIAREKGVDLYCRIDPDLICPQKWQVILVPFARSCATSQATR